MSALDRHPSAVKDLDLGHVEDQNEKDIVLEAERLGQVMSGYESDSILHTARKFWRVSFIAFLIAVASACEGFQAGLNAIILANAGFVRQFATQVGPTGVPSLAAPIVAAFGNIGTVGQVAAAITCPIISSRYGRKMGLYYAWIIVALSVAFESGARTWQVWLVGKFFAGMGIGALQTQVPVYITEISPTKIRGALIIFGTIWSSMGIFFSSICLKVIADKSPLDWLTPVYIQWGHVAAILLIFIFLPESPVWCGTKNKRALADKSMKVLYGNIEGFDYDRHWTVITTTLAHEREVAHQKSAFLDIFRGSNLMRTFASAFPTLAGQCLGITIFYVYSAYFYSQVGIVDPFQVTAIKTGLGIGLSLTSFLLVDWWGRRGLACFGCVLTWLSCLCLGIIGMTGPLNSGGRTPALIFLTCLWTMGYNWLSTAGYVYMGELSNARLRPYTVSFAYGFAAAISVINGVLVPYMLNANNWNWGIKTTWYYVGLGAIPLISCWFILPETKGRTPAELDELYETRTKAWRFRKTQTTLQKAMIATSN